MRPRAKKPEIYIIAAIAENGCIGKGNQLPWSFSEDLKWFKKLTTNQITILGLNTYQGISHLPNRYNLVLSPFVEQPQRSNRCACCNFIFIPNFTWIYKLSKKLAVRRIFICGGLYVYEQACHDYEIRKFILTKIPGSYEGDKIFPYWPLEDHGWVARKKLNRNTETLLEMFLYMR